MMSKDLTSLQNNNFSACYWNNKVDNIITSCVKCKRHKDINTKTPKNSSLQQNYNLENSKE